MKTILLLSALGFLSACVSSSGVIPIGPDTYIVTKEASTGFQGLGVMKANALKEASAYCTSQNKFVRVTNTQDAQPPYVMGNFPRTEIQFMCLNSADAELTRPKMQKTADTVIEVRK